jgi:hypothetical protein
MPSWSNSSTDCMMKSKAGSKTPPKYAARGGEPYGRAQYPPCRKQLETPGRVTAQVRS